MDGLPSFFGSSWIPIIGDLVPIIAGTKNMICEFCCLSAHHAISDSMFSKVISNLFRKRLRTKSFLLVKEDFMSTKKDETATTKATSPDASLYRPGQSVQEEQAFQVSRSVDQTKENIKRSIEETRKEIPEYSQSVTDYHQQAMDSAEEITDNYLDSQKEIINSIQSTWTNYLETVYWWLSPRKMAEMYTQTVSNFADNTIYADRIWNKMMLANMDSSKAFLRRAREASKDVSRVNINTARAFERTSSEISQGTLERQERQRRRET